MLETEDFELEAAILPMRELFAAAESRRNVHRLALAAGKDPAKQPGSLWKTKNSTEQETQLALQFYQCLQPIVASRVPVHMLDFPSFARDAGYLFQALRPIFDVRGISETDVAAALGLVARPDLINTFSENQKSDAITIEDSRISAQPLPPTGRRLMKFLGLH